MHNVKDIFKVKIGQRVYDTFTNRYGRISDIKETAFEWIEPFIKWDDTDKEECLNISLPNIKFVTE